MKTLAVKTSENLLWEDVSPSNFLVNIWQQLKKNNSPKIISHTFTLHVAKDRIFRISHCIVLLILLVLMPMWQNLQTQNFRKLHQSKFQDGSSTYNFSVLLAISYILEYSCTGNDFFSPLIFHLYQIFALSDTNLVLFRYQYAIALLLNWSKDTV